MNPSPKNILVTTYWSSDDALIQTYTIPYVEQIISALPKNSKVWLLTLEKNTIPNSLFESSLKTKNINWLPFSYNKFGFKTIVQFILLIPRLVTFCYINKVTHIHSWCTPGGSIGVLLHLFTPTKLIIDSYEPHAISMVENGTWSEKSIAFKLLFALEKLQTKKADTIVGLTKETPNYIKNTFNLDVKNYYTKPALIDLVKFDNLKAEIILPDWFNQSIKTGIYVGKFGGIYLEQEIFDFFKVVQEYYNYEFQLIVLTSTSKDEVLEYAKQANFNIEKLIIHFANREEVSTYLEYADFAINPVKPVPSKRYCTSIKDTEYWAKGLPIVITPNISDDSNIIEDNNFGVVLKNFSNQAYVDAIQKLDEILNETKTDVRETIKNFASNERSFLISESIYSIIYK